MNDVERRIRDILAHDASRAPLVEQMPDRVRPRVRRRQTGMAVVAALTSVALIAGVVAVMRSLEPVERPRPVVVPTVPPVPTGTRPVFQRTATIGGLTVTSPSDWYLVDYWGAWNSDATSLDSHAIPLLELTNFDAGLSSPVCEAGADATTRLPADGVAIFVTVGNDGSDGADLCGGRIERALPGTVGSTPYRAVMTLGPEVSDEDRAAAEQIWSSMAWNRLTFYARGRSPRYVLDGWQDGSTSSLLEVVPSSQNVELSLIETDGDGGSGESTVANVDVPEKQAIEGDTFGAVTKDAARVEYRRAGESTALVARLIDLPPTLAAAFDAYVVERPPKGGPSEVQAIGADGKLLGSNLPPLVDTQRVGTVHGFGSTWVVKESTSADGYWSSTCVEPEADASTSRPCEQGPGGGMLVQTFQAPNPAVFVTQGVGDNVGAIDVRADDGRVFHAVMLPYQGGFVAVVALDGAGQGRFVYSLTDGRTDQGLRPEAQVAWPDLGQVIGAGSFPPPEKP